MATFRGRFCSITFSSSRVGGFDSRLPSNVSRTPVFFVDEQLRRIGAAELLFPGTLGGPKLASKVLERGFPSGEPFRPMCIH